MKWVSGSLGEGLAWLPPSQAHFPTPPPLGPTPTGVRQERESFLSRSIPVRIPSCHTHPEWHPSNCSSPGEGGHVGKSAPSPFPKGHGAWGEGSPTSWGYSRAGHWGTSPGGAPILLFALDECFLTPSPPSPSSEQTAPPSQPSTCPEGSGAPVTSAGDIQNQPTGNAEKGSGWRSSKLGGFG